MELRQLRYFVTVAEELHFGRAAERLHIVQPTVSQQVQRLERELGVKLFDRSPRQVRLTTAGQQFLPAAKAVLTAEESARAVAAGLAGRAAKTLRVGTVEGMGERLDRVLEAFERQAPGVRVELVSVPVQERLRQVADHRLDAAFVRGPREAEAGLQYIPVWQDELVAAIPALHPLAGQERLTLAELADLPLRLPERHQHPALVDLVLASCRSSGVQPVPGPTSTALQDTLATIGSGRPMWTVVYAANAQRLRTRRVAFRPFHPPELALPTAVAVSDSAPLSASLRLLMAASRASGTPSAWDDRDE
ncbi:LysR substrate-binding domain-containing protein [Streptomyces sp. NBC_00280]|uniref:LysR family transcriptional regulator n=1 Tax=Streptomyces sp. NBC_00280 TaxID=2975699 RepID=UPI003253B267